MAIRKITNLALMTAILASCGGEGNSPPPVGGGPEQPPPVSGTCSLEQRQSWALDQLQQFYLFPDLLDTDVDPASYSTVEDYIDALTAPARSEGLDRGFTYLTSIEEEEDFIQNAVTEDYGWRPVLLTDNTLFLGESYGNAPARQVGLERGDEILRIGRTSGLLQTPAQILEAHGGSTAALADLLFPSTEGESIVVEWKDDVSGAISTGTLIAREYVLDPVPNDYGIEIFGDTGYLYLRTFYSEEAEDDLRSAFSDFQNAGIENLIVDLRYNGGGLLKVADLLGDLIGGGLDGQVLGQLELNDANSGENITYDFDRRSQSIEPNRIAFITTGSSASASEFIANAFAPYYGDDVAIVGSNTYGKPVGQIARDRAHCDDRLRVLAFRMVNAEGQSDYFEGLADVFPVTCRAEDNILEDLGTTVEDSIETALGFVRTGASACTPIMGVQSTQTIKPRERLLEPSNPSLSYRIQMGQL